ncbi:hypothetical protein HFP43_00765 [Streptomyces sp. SJ1-7]|nr:hypothetical protein [Streptomyces sp. SJ1-7]
MLRRRRWELAAGTVAALLAELAAEGEVPVATAARWRALLGVPDQLYLRAAQPARGGRVDEDLLRALDRPKPQYVDLGDALHLRCLGKWLARHPEGRSWRKRCPHRPGARSTRRWSWWWRPTGPGSRTEGRTTDDRRSGGVRRDRSGEGTRAAPDSPDALDSLGGGRCVRGLR